MRIKPTPITLAMNLRLALAAAALGSTFNSYPSFGARLVRVEYSDAARREDARAAERYAAKWRELYPAQYEAWQAACVEAGDAVDPSAYVNVGERTPAQPAQTH